MQRLVGERRFGLSHDEQVIENPVAAALGRRHKIALRNLEVRDRHGWQVQVHRLPVFAIVE